ncbi:hypothetical protein ACIQVK_21555 [Streptomyces sp. NPDC090493]|uniref:hypothetical protein n=1 Tax=Streptomyces sp. NPDC090493 TaxID=3365964 RepID=UPI003819BF44
MATLSADAARIIGQLEADQAAANAAGLGDANTDAYYELVTRLVSESPDPKATIRAIADLLGEHVGGAR